MHLKEPLTQGKYYHIYNCGINGKTLFRKHTNFKYFLNLYDKYVEIIAETYAWCLIGNHFHISNLTGFENLSGLKV